MRLAPGAEAAILKAIRQHPNNPLVLPDWAYWKGRDQPVVSVDRLPEQLGRHLYRTVVGPLRENQLLVQRDGVPPKNVNPHLFEVVTPATLRTHCPNGHEYAAQRPLEGVAGRRCRICYEAHLAARRVAHRRPSVSDLNRAKTHCIHGHPLSGDNLAILPDGRRRCRTCHRGWRRRQR